MASRLTSVACALALGASQPARGQTLPSGPIALADGRVTIGGDVSASTGQNDTGFFNYTDYEHSALRLLTIDLSASVKGGEHFTVLGELRSENVEAPQVYALYLRIRPWADRRFDVQAGVIPPTFGAFARRTYAEDNPLIGYPLAYQYLTSVRPDAVPVNADELLRNRGRDWLASYSIGNQTPDRGLPIASAFRWDTGVQVHAASDVIDVTASVTNGTISDPLFNDDNSGKQVAGRVAVHPTPGLIIGASAARGPFLSDSAARAAVGNGHDGDFTQTAWGGDIEYLAAVLPGALRDDSERVEASGRAGAVHRCTAARPGDLRRRTLQDPAGPLRRRPARPSGIQRDHRHNRGAKPGMPRSPASK